MNENPYQSPDLLREPTTPIGDRAGLLSAVLIGISKAVLETSVVLIVACVVIVLLVWLLKLAGAWVM